MEINSTQIAHLRQSDQMRHQEWLLTNGIGGFAMGTIAGVNTRRYHGLLIAALAPPTQRTLMLGALELHASCARTEVSLSSNQYADVVYPNGMDSIHSFECGPNWAEWLHAYRHVRIRKRIELERGKNAVVITLTNLSKRPVLLWAKPLIGFRGIHEDFHEVPGFPASVEGGTESVTIAHHDYELQCEHAGWERAPSEGWYYRFFHPIEADRGLNPSQDLYSPFTLSIETPPGASAQIRFATAGEASALPLVQATGTDLESRLKQATDHFLVAGARTSILAGYPWFSDWGRDTMISIPGICLETGRAEIARQILRDYAGAMNRGLIPNRFSEQGVGADYNTVDATLWFANAVYKTLKHEWEPGFAAEMLEVLSEVRRHHINGTEFGIEIDREDGLLRQGEYGHNLTWMDAKIDDWVVTPRHGKPVEINALWVNLLRILVWMGTKLERTTETWEVEAFRAESSFNKKFWHRVRGHYLDTVGPDDASLRPNQIIAMALPFTPCHSAQASKSLHLCREMLVTEVGLRSLGPKEPDYQGRFEGPVRELDARYHQGTVWPWLLGSYLRACIRFAPELLRRDDWPAMMERMLTHRGLGGISEVYDGDAPHRAGGCPWQAWSVAELLHAIGELSRRARAF